MMDEQDADYCPNNKAYTATVLVDCLTNEYAIEFDFSNKWAEAIGQISPIEDIKMHEEKYKGKCNMLWTHTNL